VSTKLSSEVVWEARKGRRNSRYQASFQSGGCLGVDMVMPVELVTSLTKIYICIGR
jgi:hypothetical protein